MGSLGTRLRIHAFAASNARIHIRGFQHRGGPVCIRPYVRFVHARPY